MECIGRLITGSRSSLRSIGSIHQATVFDRWTGKSLREPTSSTSSDMCKKFATLTYGLDVAKGVMALVGNPLALGETYHIARETSNKWEDVLTIYLNILEEHLGYRPKVLLKGLEDFTKCHSGKYQIVYDRLFNRQFDNSKISKYINNNDFRKLEDGLETCMKQFLREPEFSSINWKTEAQKDRLAKERTPLREISCIKQKVRYLFFRYFG